MENPFVVGGLIVLIYMVWWFIVAQILNNNGLIDVGWGLGFILLIWLLPGQIDPLLKFCVTLWGIRLSVYLGIRNIGEPEDWRYVNMRKRWGKKFYQKAFIRIFALQGIAMWFLAIIFMFAALEPGLLHPTLSLIGFLVFFQGFLWESIADYQLYVFKKNSENKNKVLKSGLWAYSRHPNYFGEMLIWWGLYIMILPNSYWYLAIFSPVLLSFLLYKVSGVPILENSFSENEDYKAYKESVNKIIPKFW